MRAQRVQFAPGIGGVDIILTEDELSAYALEKIKGAASGGIISQLSTDTSETVTNDDGSVQVLENITSRSIDEVHYMIPDAALATYGLLLCTSSDRETIQYLMYIREHGEPEPTEDGTNAWTSAYGELEKLAAPAEVVALDAEDSVTDSSGSEVSGIAKTRAMLGLPSFSGSIAVAALDVDEDANSTVSADAFYDVPDAVLGMFDADAVAKATEQFIDGLAPQK